MKKYTLSHARKIVEFFEEQTAIFWNPNSTKEQVASASAVIFDDENLQNYERARKIVLRKSARPSR